MNHRQLIRLAAIAWLVAGAFYLAAETLTASAFTPVYDYGYNYISDLGVPGCGVEFQGRFICSPLHQVMNTAFITQGILFVLAAWWLTNVLVGARKTVFLVLATLHGVGMILVGSTTATAHDTAYVHLSGAVLAIIGGNVASWISAPLWERLERTWLLRPISIILSVIGLLCVGLLIVNIIHPKGKLAQDGIWERGSVYTILLWEVIAGISLLASLSPKRL